MVWRGSENWTEGKPLPIRRRVENSASVPNRGDWKFWRIREEIRQENLLALNYAVGGEKALRKRKVKKLVAGVGFEPTAFRL